MYSKENKILDLPISSLDDYKRNKFTKNTSRLNNDNNPILKNKVTTLDVFIKSAKITRKMIANNRSANRYEIVEIEALFFYTARSTNMTEDALRHQVYSELSIKSVTDLSLADYIKIRDHLWEISQNSE